MGISTRLGGLDGLGICHGIENQNRDEHGRAKKPDLANWAPGGAVMRVDGRYWHAEVSAGLGRNLEDISEFLKESPKITKKWLFRPDSQKKMEKVARIGELWLTKGVCGVQSGGNRDEVEAETTPSDI